MKHRPRILALLAASAVVGSIALSGCGSSSDDTTSSAEASAVLTQDITSKIVKDDAISAELPESVRSAGTLTVGTTQTPGHLPGSGERQGRPVLRAGTEPEVRREARRGNQVPRPDQLHTSRIRHRKGLGPGQADLRCREQADRDGGLRKDLRQVGCPGYGRREVDGQPAEHLLIDGLPRGRCERPGRGSLSVRRSVGSRGSRGSRCSSVCGK